MYPPITKSIKLKNIMTFFGLGKHPLGHFFALHSFLAVQSIRKKNFGALAPFPDGVA